MNSTAWNSIIRPQRLGATPLWLAASNAVGKQSVPEHASDLVLVSTRGGRSGYEPCGGNHEAAMSLMVVQLLLSANADPTVATIDGTEPILAAARNGHAPIVDALLAAHADPNAADSAGHTPLAEVHFFLCNAYHGGPALLVAAGRLRLGDGSSQPDCRSV